MYRDEATKLTDNALEQLALALDQGHSATLTAYLKTLAKFHNYSFGNVLLIAFQKPDATHVAGFHTWRKLGRFVKKGEKGIAILAPIAFRAKADAHEVVENNDVAIVPVRQMIRGFKAVYVFDVSQTDGKPIADFARISGSPCEYLVRVRDLIIQRGIQLEYAPILDGAKGFSESGVITLRPDLDPAEEFAVLVHEFAHELLHKKERRSGTTRTIRETEAEAVAFVVSQAIGLDCSTRSSDYIQLYRGDRSTLQESLKHIQATAAGIIRELTASAPLQTRE
jgi:antirestriction protein ArdC